jgi:hypothetical protein
MKIRAPIPILLALAALILFAGCRVGGVRSVEAENERLRQELTERDKKQQDLEGQIAELKVKLSEANRSQKPMAQEALDALPRVTNVEISSLSGFEPTDPNVPATGVAVWFETRDGRGRFVQAVGTATIEALIRPSEVPSGTNPTPELVASLALSPSQLRDAYRSSFTGTHYSAELKLDKPIERGPGKTPSLVIRVEFQDAITGEVLRSERVISPRVASSAGAVQAK